MWCLLVAACSYYTGARLSDVLKMAKVRSIEQGARFVCYSGPEGELPQVKLTVLVTYVHRTAILFRLLALLGSYGKHVPVV